MNTKFPSFSSVEQTQKINELLGACESYYTVSDIFQYLPNEIEYRGKRGYLTVDTYSLSWTAYHAQQLIIAKTFSMPIGIDINIFDVFILALEFVINNDLNTKNNKITGLLLKTDEKNRGHVFTKECLENAIKEFNSHHNTKKFDLHHDTSPVDLKLSTDGVHVNVTLLDSNNNDIIKNIIK